MANNNFGPGFFVTGTDTGIGKTFFATGLVEALVAAGLQTAVMKPLAVGCRRTDAGWVNEDAEALRNAANVELDYETVNPYAFEAAIAPHIAARESGVTVSMTRIRQCFDRVAAACDTVVVEGAGGWLVPVNEKRSMSDMARALGLPIILVVGMRLGCLNHALLSADRIVQDGLRLVAWVANQVDPNFDRASENLDSLRERIAAPLIAKLPYATDCRDAGTAGKIDLDTLRETLS